MVICFVGMGGSWISLSDNNNDIKNRHQSWTEKDTDCAKAQIKIKFKTELKQSIFNVEILKKC